MNAMFDLTGKTAFVTDSSSTTRACSGAPFTEFPVAEWDAVIASNLSSVFYVSRFVAPAMIERGSGKIVNIASVQSMLARQTIAPYSASDFVSGQNIFVDGGVTSVV